MFGKSDVWMGTLDNFIHLITADKPGITVWIWPFVCSNPLPLGPAKTRKNMPRKFGAGELTSLA
jgi:hypothetical protein